MSTMSVTVVALTPAGYLARFDVDVDVDVADRIGTLRLLVGGTFERRRRRRRYSRAGVGYPAMPVPAATSW